MYFITHYECYLICMGCVCHAYRRHILCFTTKRYCDRINIANTKGQHSLCLSFAHLIYPSRWPRGLRHGSAAARLLGLLVRISQGAWMSVFRQRSLRRADHPSRGVLLSVVCLWSRILNREEAKTHCGRSSHNKTYLLCTIRISSTNFVVGVRSGSPIQVSSPKLCTYLQASLTGTVRRTVRMEAFHNYTAQFVGRDSSVGIATRHELEGPGIES
jgi:hypothetical protein